MLVQSLPNVKEFVVLPQVCAHCLGSEQSKLLEGSTSKKLSFRKDEHKMSKKKKISIFTPIAKVHLTLYLEESKSW